MSDDRPDDGGTAEPGMTEAEQELLAAFDRLRPQGGLRWAFDDALRRVDQPDLDSSAGAHPWGGLPHDLWDRGRSARIGQRFVGEVARVMADLLAADARSAADAAVAAVNGDRFVAAWDALAYLSARVEVLERHLDPLGVEVAEWASPSGDVAEWHDAVLGWLGDHAPSGPVIVGESGDGALVASLRGAGREVRGVEPRGPSVWGAFGEGIPGILFDHVDRHLRSADGDSAAGVVLIGCIDRADLAGKVDLLDQALRVIRPGGSLVLLCADPVAWEESLTPPARDLASGRPFHPDTWLWLLRRAGVADPVLHRSDRGTVHAVLARVDR